MSVAKHAPVSGPTRTESDSMGSIDVPEIDIGARRPIAR